MCIILHENWKFACIISGNASNFNVCPVGAVSKTMRSYFPDSMWLIAEAKAVASSIPGILQKLWKSYKRFKNCKYFLCYVLEGW